MIKPRYALLLLPLALAACSSNDDDDAGNADETPSATVGTYQLTFTNRSTSQPMTPPVVAVHDASVRLFEVGKKATDEVRQVAEDGNIMPLVALATSLKGNGVASAAAAFTDPAAPGPLLPGNSATISLESDKDGQVLSVVSMVVCTNDGFTGFDSRALPKSTETAMAAIYDAGSEVNTLKTDYWVKPCGSDTNLHEDENGVIAAHPGQSGSETPVHDFAAGTEYLEMTVTRN